MKAQSFLHLLLTISVPIMSTSSTSLLDVPGTAVYKRSLYTKQLHSSILIPTEGLHMITREDHDSVNSPADEPYGSFEVIRRVKEQLGMSRTSAEVAKSGRSWLKMGLITMRCNTMRCNKTGLIWRRASGLKLRAR